MLSSSSSNEISIETLKIQLAQNEAQFEGIEGQLNSDQRDQQEAFFCTIGLNIMLNPIILDDGNTYDKDVLIDWAQRCIERGEPITAPNTRVPYVLDRLVPNRALLSAIIREYPIVAEILRLRERIKTLEEAQARMASQNNNADSSSSSVSSASPAIEPAPLPSAPELPAPNLAGNHAVSASAIPASHRVLSVAASASAIPASQSTPSAAASVMSASHLAPCVASSSAMSVSHQAPRVAASASASSSSSSANPISTPGFFSRFSFANSSSTSSGAATSKACSSSSSAGPRNAGYDHLAKLLLVGDSCEGMKSKFLLSFSDDSCNSQFITTIGIDFKIKTVELNKQKIKLQIWDTAGQERFRTVTTAYYRGAQGVMLCYDVTDEQSFQNVRNWMRIIEQHAADNIILHLIGLNSDCAAEKREVSSERGLEMANEFGISFFECSAATKTNITESFMSLISQIMNSQNLLAVPQPRKEQAEERKPNKCLIM